MELCKRRVCWQCVGACVSFLNERAAARWRIGVSNWTSERDAQQL